MQIHYVILGSMENNLLEEIVERKQVDDLKNGLKDGMLLLKVAKNYGEFPSLSFSLIFVRKMK